MDQLSVVFCAARAAEPTESMGEGANDQLNREAKKQ